jgi:ABC-type sugar transport system substrate-binding protein
MNTYLRVGVAALALACALGLSARANARTLWICDVPNEGTVTFVTAADAARHGIDTANARAGLVFHDQFGETCHVESG